MKKCTLNSIIRIGIFGAITLVSNLAWGQGSTAFANPVVTNSIGQPIAGAVVALCKANPGVAPTALCSGSNLATTYTDITIGVPCTGILQGLNNQASPSVGSGCSNPGLADGVGNVIVFSTSSTYWCEYSGRGIIGIIVQVCVVPNSGGSGPAGAVLVVPTLAQDQSIKQPSVGGLSTPGTSLNANVLEQVRYADDFQKQFPLSPAGTISVGVNTITINAVRGISTYSCVSPGTGCAGNFGGVGTTHFIRIAGTGTPEAVKITGTTCTGASTGTCTVTFTAANSHSAGYTVNSATAGFQEALVDSYTLATNNPTTGREIDCSPYPTTGHYIIYATIFVDGLAASQTSPTFFEGHGCTLEDDVVGGPMLKASTNSYVTFEHFTLAILPGIGRAANGTQVFINDSGQLFHFSYNHFGLPAGYTGSDAVDRVITVINDQGATIDHNDFEGVPLNCDATWCSAMVYGDPTNNAAIGDIHDNYFSQNYDPVLWESGNGLTLKDNVFQNWVHYPWKYRGGLLAFVNQGGNYYEGNCSLNNPDFGVGAAGFGYSCVTGPQIDTTGSQNAYKPGQERNDVGGPRLFTSTGGNIYNYYIVGNDGSGHSSRPLFIGTASTDGVTPFTVKYLKFGASTYDVLRAGPQAQDGTDAAPWGTGNWAVAPGVVCAANPCIYTENFAAPTAYTVLAEFQGSSYTPQIDYWPVPLFLHGQTGSESVYIGPYVGGFVSASVPGTANNYYDAIFTSEPGGPGNITGMHILHQASLNAGSTGNKNPGAMILNPDAVTNFMVNRKGRINMPSLAALTPGFNNNCMYQVYDPEGNKTLATAHHQPLLKANGADTCMGYDTNQSWLAFQGGLNGIRFYVNHIMDSGVSQAFEILPAGPKTRFQFTSTIVTGTAPFSIASTTPVANLAATPTTYNAAGTQQINAHLVEGTCTLGTSCAVTLVGSAIYTGAATYACTAQDTTAIAATKIVQASGSAFTITGTGTDVLTYQCSGN